MENHQEELTALTKAVIGTHPAGVSLPEMSLQQQHLTLIDSDTHLTWLIQRKIRMKIQQMVLSFLKALECVDKSQLTDKIGSSEIPCPVLLPCSTVSFSAQHSHLHQAPLWGVQEQETCKRREIWGEKWLSRGCEAQAELSPSAQELCQESEHAWGALSPALWCSELGCCWRSFNNLPLKGCCLASLQARPTTQFKKLDPALFLLGF